MFCKTCEKPATKEINKIPGEILGRYVCGCERDKFGNGGPTFPLVKELRVTK